MNDGDRQIADLIVERLQAEFPKLKEQYDRDSPVPYFVLDDVLAAPLAHGIYDAFPETSTMTLKRSLRELKFVSAQMDRCNELIGNAVFAFQDPRIVALVSEITGIKQLEPDSHLYAGGISTMLKGHFLNPHLDNSHDKHRERYRVLNLLYYVSPGWELGFGGHLELWPNGPKREQITIPSTFNRLVVMATTRRSWHSVTPIKADGVRCCVSNYYFSQVSPEEEDYFHVTSFRARPEQPLRDLVLRTDIKLRMLLRKIRPQGIVENKHYYKRTTP